MLMVLGSIADVLAFAAVIVVGVAFGLAGASSEVPLLVTKMVALAPVPSVGVLWAVAGAAAVVVITGCALHSRAVAAARRISLAFRGYRASVGELVRQPSRLAPLMAKLGGAALPASNFCALMIDYMIAGASGNALPTPGGFGAADAAYVGVMVAAGMPLASAIAAILAFRLVTFWGPAVIGLSLIRPLRRRGAL